MLFGPIAKSSAAAVENKVGEGHFIKCEKRWGKTTRGRSCPSLFSNGMGRPRADSLSLSSLFTLCQRLATRTLCRARIPSFHSWEDVSRFYAMEELWRGLDVILRFDGWRRRPRRRMTLAAYIAPVHACMHGASSPCIALPCLGAVLCRPSPSFCLLTRKMAKSPAVALSLSLSFASITSILFWLPSPPSSPSSSLGSLPTPSHDSQPPPSTSTPIHSLSQSLCPSTLIPLSHARLS